LAEGEKEREKKKFWNLFPVETEGGSLFVACEKGKLLPKRKRGRGPFLVGRAEKAKGAGSSTEGRWMVAMDQGCREEKRLW